MSEGVAARATETLKSGAAALGVGGNTTQQHASAGETTMNTTSAEDYHNSFHVHPGDASEQEHGKDPSNRVYPTQGSTKAPEFLKDLGKGDNNAGAGGLPASDQPTQPPVDPKTDASNV